MARSGRDRFLRRRRCRRSTVMTGLAPYPTISSSTSWAALTPARFSVPGCSPSAGPAFPASTPSSYRRWVLLHRDPEVTGFHNRSGTARVEKAMRHIRRYERRAMRALTSSVERLSDAAAGRRVSRLTLEFFSTHNTGCINRLISTAIDAWEVRDVVAVAKPVYSQRRMFHAFPSQGICEAPHASRLRSLKLAGCTLPPLRGHGALTVLVLQDTPMSTPVSAYEGIFTSCPQLQVLHLISCYSAGIGQITVDAPGSDLRELVVDNCVGFTRIWICLRALPRLERLACLGTTVSFETTSFPCLRPDRWIVPSVSSPSLLPNLRRLLVADVPRCWDVSWPRLLLETAPSLETLHVHIAPPCKEEEEPSGDEISWQPAMLGHRHLKEFVMAGFEGTEGQVYLVRFVMGVCSTALRHVAMFKKGLVRDKGHWGWEMATQQQQHSHWTDEEKDKTLKQIVNGVPSSSTASPVIVFG